MATYKNALGYVCLEREWIADSCYRKTKRPIHKGQLEVLGKLGFSETEISAIPNSNVARYMIAKEIKRLAKMIIGSGHEIPITSYTSFNSLEKYMKRHHISPKDFPR